MTALSLLTNELRRVKVPKQYVSLRQGSVYLGLQGPVHVHARTRGREHELSRAGKRIDLGRGPAGQRGCALLHLSPLGTQGSRPL